MLVSFVGSVDGTPTNGSAPSAITPHANTQPGDLLLFYHFSTIVTNGTQSVTLPTGFTSIVNNRDANGLIAAGWRLYQASDTNFTATIANHASGNSGDTVVEMLSTWRGISQATPVGNVSSTFTNGSASLNVGAIGVPSGTIAPGSAIVFFWGKEENTTAQTTLSGDSLTWAQGNVIDTTSGTDGSAGTQNGINLTASAITPTSKTVVTTGTAATSRGVSFILNAQADATVNMPPYVPYTGQW